MRSDRTWMTLPGLLLAASATVAAAQQAPATAAAAAPPLPIPAVGDMAPDFTFKGITRYGMLRDAARLTDYRGETVVVWLFFKARTRG
jgi:hypothetical protein